jgi:hypothetical protein
VVGHLEHSGYGLVGSGGRHYVFGGLAVADYTHNDQHRVVTLQLVEPSLLPKSDEDFLYYRELGSGRRWAIGRHPLKDDSYAVYYEPLAGAGSAPGTWTLFHRARLIWPEGQKQAVTAQPPAKHPQMKLGECLSRP